MNVSTSVTRSSWLVGGELCVGCFPELDSNNQDIYGNVRVEVHKSPAFESRSDAAAGRNGLCARLFIHPCLPAATWRLRASMFQSTLMVTWESFRCVVTGFDIVELSVNRQVCDTRNLDVPHCKHVLDPTDDAQRKIKGLGIRSRNGTTLLAFVH
jgi:hypothetical protein